MAQRTGADGLLAPRAKLARAGVLPALAIALALALSSCGGDSSAQPETASAPSSQAGSQSTSSQAKSPAEGSSGAQGKGQGQAKGTPASGSGAGTAPGQGAKHGQRIAAPKGPTESAPTPAQVAHATVADMVLQSPSLPAAGPGGLPHLPATYTCDGANTSPALRWDGVPQGTAELALFAMNVQPVEEKIFFDWAVAGIDPGLDSIDAGQLPKGTVTGQNSFGKAGYSICPGGEGETYMFALYALPQRLPAKRGFDPRDYRQQVLDLSGNVGLLPTAYVRG